MTWEGRLFHWAAHGRPLFAPSSTHRCIMATPLPRLQCSREFWAADPRGVKEISRACALEDEARAALAKAVPQQLAARLEEMQAAGGPAPPPASEQALRGVDGRLGGAHVGESSRAG